MIYAARPASDDCVGVHGACRSVAAFKQSMALLGAADRLTEVGIVVSDYRDHITPKDQTVAVEERTDVGRIPAGMFLATAFLVAASTSITFLAGPISNVTDRAAQSAQDLSIYRAAVLGDDQREPTRNLDAFTRPDDAGRGRDALEHRDNNHRPTGPATTGVTTERVPAPADAESNEVDK